jgi:hypothetical protein
MATATARSNRQTRSFSLERDVIQELEETKGSESASERVNQLLRSALEAEKYARLEEEGRQFYGSINDREEARAFRSAAVKSWARE